MFLAHICEPCHYEELAIEFVPKHKCPKCGVLTEDRFLDEEKEMDI